MVLRSVKKKNHPDVNKNPKAHKEFLKIQEAYNVLSKNESRRNYDLGLAKPFHTVHNTTNVHYTQWEDHQKERKNPWDDPYFYQNRDRSRDSYYEQQPYYGIRGVKKVSNGTVATFLIIMAFFSFIGQMLAINYSFNAQKERMRRRSDSTQETLNEIRERANRNGNELQLEILRQRFEEAERERQRLKKTVY